jgi:hypothetical protein
MIEIDIFDRLKGLVSNRVYPIIMPQNPTLPAVVYTRITNTPINVLGHQPTLDQVRVQIDVWANTYKESKTLAKSVRNAMETASFSATLQSDDESYEPETGLYRVSSDYYVYERGVSS